MSLLRRCVQSVVEAHVVAESPFCREAAVQQLLGIMCDAVVHLEDYLVVALWIDRATSNLGILCCTATFTNIGDSLEEWWKARTSMRTTSRQRFR